MTQQLIYTSAPQGLKPGSRGFCTVATTPGMAANLADRLEAISGYRHPFAPGDSRNPINYSFVAFTLGGRKLSVLSRVADAGLDYTQRSNKLAHHVVLEPNELMPAGPLALLSHSQFMETAWSGEPRTIAPKALPAIKALGQPCTLWKQFTGDAGWGGYLAEPVVDRPATTVNLIFQPGMPVLELLTEAMALLPPERRWQTTFGTYFTKLPPGLDCQWRCLLDGTTEAQLAQRMPRSVVISLVDLANNHRPAPAGRLVDAARTGQLPLTKQVNKPVSAAAFPSTGAVQLNDRELEQELQLADDLPNEATPRTTRDRTIHPHETSRDEMRLLPPSLSLHRGINDLQLSGNRESQRSLLQGRNQRRRPWKWIAAVVSFGIFATASAFAYRFYWDRVKDLEPNQLASNVPPAVKREISGKDEAISFDGQTASKGAGKQQRDSATSAEQKEIPIPAEAAGLTTSGESENNSKQNQPTDIAIELPQESKSLSERAKNWVPIPMEAFNERKLPQYDLVGLVDEFNAVDGYYFKADIRPDGLTGDVGMIPLNCLAST